MSNQRIADQFNLLRDVRAVETRGWHLQQNVNRVAVFAPSVIKNELKLTDKHWIAGSSIEEALSFIYGVEEMLRLTKPKVFSKLYGRE